MAFWCGQQQQQQQQVISWDQPEGLMGPEPELLSVQVFAERQLSKDAPIGTGVIPLHHVSHGSNVC
jgi:hypothetical protein